MGIFDKLRSKGTSKEELLTQLDALNTRIAELEQKLTEQGKPLPPIAEKGLGQLRTLLPGSFQEADAAAVLTQLHERIAQLEQALK